MSSGIDDRQAIFEMPRMISYCILHKKHNCFCMRPKHNEEDYGDTKKDKNLKKNLNAH